jgi:hypothetical protein
MVTLKKRLCENCNKRYATSKNNKCNECKRELMKPRFSDEKFCTVCRRVLNLEAKIRSPKCPNCIRRERKIKLASKFGGQCKMCGYNTYIGALHFHHTDSSEKYLYGKHGSASLKEVTEHPERFILLCANCHALSHFLGKAGYEHIGNDSYIFV